MQAGARFRLSAQVRLVAACAVVGAVIWGTGGRADDWLGFRGLDRQGWAATAKVPPEWSTNQGLRWKTVIPGRGHSSPVVSGGSVVVTTAYASPEHERMRRVARALAGGLTAGLLGWTVWRWTRAAPGARGRWLVRAGLLTVVLVLCVGVWTRLGLETHDIRAWLASMLGLLACVVVAGLVFPAGSVSRLWVAGASGLVTVPAFLLFPERDELFRIDSLSVMLSWVLLAIPLALALLGVGLHVLARRHGAKVPPADGRSGWLVAAVALAAGVLYFTDANYLRRAKTLARSVMSLGLEDGQVRWAWNGLAGRQRPLTRINTAATPTPVTDGERVIAWFASAGLMGVDRTGRLLWTNREVVSEPVYGTATSPVFHEGVVVLVSDVEERSTPGARPRSWVAGVDSVSGRVLWRNERRGHPRFASYATPVVQSSRGTNIVWVSGWHGVDGYELRSGSPIAHYAYDMEAHHLAASPALEGSRLFVPGAKVHRCLDLDKLRGGADPVVWSQAARGEISSSPAVADGLVFIVDEAGWAACLELASGRKCWEQRLRGRFFASVVVAGDHVYFSSENGTVSVIARSGEFRLLAENAVPEKLYASLTPAGDRVLLRGVENLYCFGGSGAP